MATPKSTSIQFPVGAGVLTVQTSTGIKSIFYPAADTPYPDPALFMASPTAVPGEPFLVVGHFSGVAKVFLRAVGTEKLVPCEVQVQGPKGIQALVPATMPLTQYAIVVQDGSVLANELPLNDPRVLHADWTKIVSGANFKLIGRNLLFAGATPRVYLAAGSELVECTVNMAASTDTRLAVTAPAGLTVGTNYVPVVNTGLVAGTAGNVPTPLVLECLAPVEVTLGLDPRVAAGLPFLHLDYPADDSRFMPLAADGVTSDTVAINDACRQISSWGGGVYQVPAGDYRIDQEGIAAISTYENVFINGAGEDATTFHFGYGHKDSFGLALYMDDNNVGLGNLSFDNANEQGSWDGSVLLNGGKDNVVFKNVGMRLRGQSLKTTAGVTRLHIDGGHYVNRTLRTEGTVNEGPLTLHNCSNVWLRNVYTSHEVGQTSLRDSINVCIENPRFTRDAAINNGRNKVERDCRGGSADFVENFAMWSGSIDTINGPATDANASGETWLSEGGGLQRGDSEWGTVTSATASTLVDRTAKFGTRDRHGVKAKPVIAIMNGRGAYQWRYCTVTNGTTLTLEKPWTIVPDATSTYTLTNWSAKGWTFDGVAANNNRAGFSFFAASTWDVVIDGLTLNNNHAILFKPYQRAMSGADNADGACTPVWSVQLRYNYVNDTGNPIAYVPAYIGVAPVSTVAPVVGGLAVAVEMRFNQVNALPGYVPFPAVDGVPNAYPYNDSIQRNGFYLRSEMQVFNGAGQFISNRGVPLIFTCLGWKNTAKNCPSVYVTDSGANTTLLSAGGTFNTPALVADELLGDATKASTLTRLLPTLA